MPTNSELWDSRYAGDDFAFGTEPNDFLVSVADRLPAGGKVLCLGDGEGRNGVFLAGRGHDVTAVDLSAVGLEKARGLAAERGVAITTVVADLAEFDIGRERWDTVVSVFCHLPPALRADVHRRVVGGLCPGGVLVLEAYTPAQIGRGTGGPSDPEMTPTADVLRREFAGLGFEILRETEREIHEGRLHDGPSAVVQALAVKPQ